MKRKNSQEHRKVWKRHNGPIPKDADGRSYDVHHIDGDPENNIIDNLIALPIHEHYEIHYWQEDWSACRAIAMRGIVSPEDVSALASKMMLDRIANGTSPFQDPEFLKRKSEETRQRNLELAAIGANPWQNPEFIENQRERKRDRENSLVEAGIHLFQDLEHQSMLKQVNEERLRNGTHNFQDGERARQHQLELVESGIHHFLGGEMQRRTQRELVESGNHHLLSDNPNSTRVSCIGCRKEVTRPILGRHDSTCHLDKNPTPGLGRRKKFIQNS